MMWTLLHGNMINWSSEVSDIHELTNILKVVKNDK